MIITATWVFFTVLLYPTPAGAQKVDLADIDCYEVGKGCRQAGSTFKPFVLATALKQGYSLNSYWSGPSTITMPLPPASA